MLSLSKRSVNCLQPSHWPSDSFTPISGQCEVALTTLVSQRQYYIPDPAYIALSTFKWCTKGLTPGNVIYKKLWSQQIVLLEDLSVMLSMPLLQRKFSRICLLQLKTSCEAYSWGLLCERFCSWEDSITETTIFEFRILFCILIQRNSWKLSESQLFQKYKF